MPLSHFHGLNAGKPRFLSVGKPYKIRGETVDEIVLFRDESGRTVGLPAIFKMFKNFISSVTLPSLTVADRRQS